MRKRFWNGKWREVLDSGLVGPACATPTDAERELLAAQEAAVKFEVRPVALKGGASCTACGQRLEYLENKRCSACGEEFVMEVDLSDGEPPPPSMSLRAAPPRQPIEAMRPVPGTKEYKVLTQRDEFFKSKFNPQALEDLINIHAGEGWRVVGMTATDVGSFWGSFLQKGGGAARQELVILLERTVE